MNKKNFSIYKFFNFENRKAVIKKEIIGGFSSFLALIYIISVESNFLQSGSDTLTMHGIFLSTCLVLGIGTIIMGISTNTPTVATPSMGLNAIFAINIAKASNSSFELAMIATILSGLLLVIICCTKLLSILLRSIPDGLSLCITIGFGFFIAYVGLVKMHWVMIDQNNSLPIASLSNFKVFFPSIILGTIGIFLTLFFYFKKIPGGIAITMVIGLIACVILANIFSKSSAIISKNFSECIWRGWKYNNFNFLLNIKSMINEVFVSTRIWGNFTLYIAIFIFLIISIFNISSTSIIVAKYVAINDEEYKRLVQKQNKTFSFIYLASGLIGVSPATIAIESNVGISQGAKTGIASIFTGLFFLLTIAIYPIFRLMPNCMIGVASFYIGLLMSLNLAKIDWKKPEFGFSVFFVIIFSVITYNITNGIAFVFISYTLIMILTKKIRMLSKTIFAITILFLIYFILNTFI